MRNDFRLRSDLTFMDVETDQCAGLIKPLKGGKGFSVHRALTNGYERNRIAVVKSIGDALPALTTYYDENPPRWKGKYRISGGMAGTFSKQLPLRPGVPFQIAQHLHGQSPRARPMTM
jgi:hypothetical protein